MKINRGQMAIYGLMLGIVVFVLALSLAPSVKVFTSNAMSETVGDTVGLNCSTTDDIFIKSTCIVLDISLFYFIGILIIISAILVTAKYLFTGD